MNIKNLKQAEQKFLNKYPGGFQHPEMIALGKKHKMDQMTELTKSSLSKKAFETTENMISALGNNC